MKENNQMTIEETGSSPLIDSDLNERVKREAGLVVSPTDMQQTSGLEVQQVGLDDIDALDSAQVVPIDLSSEYWSPALAGETRRVIFDCLDTQDVLSSNGSGEVIPLECAFFFVKENGSVKRMCNGSKRLLSVIQSFNIQRGSALEITYDGKKKNKSNSFMSDNWIVRPLVIKVKAN